MDSRLYFVIGDILVNVFAGLVVGWLVALMIGPGWNMWLAMIIAMLVGMVVATVLWFPLSLPYGAMEVMVPMMFSGMLSGMVVGMWSAMSVVTVSAATMAGAALGLAGIVVIWVINNTVRGVVK